MVHGGWFSDGSAMPEKWVGIWQKLKWGRRVLYGVLFCVLKKKEGVLIERREYNLYQFYNQYNTWRESIKMGVKYGGMGVDR